MCNLYGQLSQRKIPSHHYLLLVREQYPWDPLKKGKTHGLSKTSNPNAHWILFLFCIFWWWVCHFFFFLEIVIFDIESWNCVERERKLEMGFSVGFWVMGCESFYLLEIVTLKWCLRESELEFRNGVMGFVWFCVFGNGFVKNFCLCLSESFIN